MKAKVFGIYFDDLKKNEDGMYVTICDACAKKYEASLYGLEYVLSPSDGMFICGVRDCWNPIDYRIQVVEW